MQCQSMHWERNNERYHTKITWLFAPDNQRYKIQNKQQHELYLMVPSTIKAQTATMAEARQRLCTRWLFRVNSLEPGQHNVHTLIAKKDCSCSHAPDGSATSSIARKTSPKPHTLTELTVCHLLPEASDSSMNARLPRSDGNGLGSRRPR